MSARHESAVVPGAYPHVGGCEGCRVERVCNFCGDPLGRGRCTNGRCADCHRKHCTSGGVTDYGHGYGLPAPATS